jgi:hypothetical protein
MPLNTKLSFAHSNAAAVEGAWPVMGFSSHQQMHAEPPGRIVVGLGTPTSLASIMVVGPHHTAATHAGEAPKRASGSTWFGRASQLEIGLSFYVLVAISPPRSLHKIRPLFVPHCRRQRRAEPRSPPREPRDICSRLEARMRCRGAARVARCCH